jgi:hypothetical protein
VGSANHLQTEYVHTAMLTSCCPGTGPPGRLKQFHDTDSTTNVQSGTRFEDCNFKQDTLYTYTEHCGTLAQYLHFLVYPNSLIHYHSKRALVWRFNVADDNTTYFGLHAKCSILTKFGFLRHIFHRSPKYQSSRKSVQWESPLHGDRRTDGRLGMTKATGAFRDVRTRC